MKNGLTLIMCLLFTGAIYAQKLSDLGIPNSSELQKVTDKVVDHKAKLPTKAVLKLSKYYKADDGSIIAIRQIGDKIYAIADRYDRRFSSVWTGTVKSNGIEVNYHYIPKGKAKGSDNIFFKNSGSGRMQKLTLTTANSTFNFKTMTAISKLPQKLPINDRAWYRGNTLNNLTGRYKVDNVGRDYLLDLGKKVIMYTVGGRETSHTRPQFATLFIGDRNGNSITGFYIDLPYGHTDGMGKATFTVIGPHNFRANYDYFYYGVVHKRQIDDNKEIIK